MLVPFMLLLLSLAGVFVAFALPGWSDLIMVAGPAALASLYLLLRARPARQDRTAWVILDGSNVMHWHDGTPNLATVREVLDLARDLGMTPGVVFDANAGHLLFGKYAGDRAFARSLELARDRIMVVAKGTPADPAILTAARDLGARVISNDRFRDWIQDFPELTAPGHLIPGGYRNASPWLDITQSDDT